jgi:ABC-2 type transport system ATP-binding protein
MPAIDLRHVAKTYRGRVQALRGIEMRVESGEIFGLLGPNGAGKSTLVKIIMTVIRPTRADGTVLGHPLGNKATLARIGYLPENHRFPRYLTGRQTLEFFGRLSGTPGALIRRKAQELLELVGMRDWADRRVGMYSKGMMQRVGLAQALMNDPDLILLDEPTDGVDPVGRRDIRDVLLRLREQGKAVLINSHLLSELELVCDRVAILARGQVVRQGMVDELAGARMRYEVEVFPPGGPTDALALDASLRASPQALLAVAQACRAAWAGIVPVSLHPVPAWDGSVPIERGTLPSGVWLEIQGNLLRIGTSDASEVQPLLDRIRQAGLLVKRVELTRPTLEDLFIEAVGDGTPGASLPSSTPPAVATGGVA